MSDDRTSVEELLKKYEAGQRYFVDLDFPDGSILYNANLAESTFEGCFLSSSDARFANFRGAIFRNCNLKCTDFRKANLRNAVFDGSLLESTAFKGALLVGADFSKALCYGSKLDDIRPDEWDFEHNPIDTPPKRE